jgi:tetratricopeptide (TPR) repeat protein
MTTAGFPNRIRMPSGLGNRLAYLGLCLLIARATSAGHPEATSSRKLSNRYNDAIQHFRSGDFGSGCLAADQMMQEHPNYYGAYNLGGLCAAKRGDFRQAELHFRKSLFLNPKFVDGRVNLATNLAAQGQGQEAISQFREVIELNPSHVTALYNLGKLELFAGSHQSAVRHLQRAKKLAPKDVQVSLALAKGLSKSQQYADAAAVLDSVQSEGQSSSEWHALRGYADYKLDNPEKALEHLRQAIQMNPRSEDYYLKMGELMLFHRSTDAAKAFFETGLQQLPNSALMHYGLAVCYFVDQSDPKQFEEHLETALKIEPKFEPALSLLCQSFKQNSQWTSLRETAERLLGLNPQAHEGYYYKAVALIQNHPAAPAENSLQEARQLLEEAIRLEPDSVDPRIACGKLLIQLDEIPQAIIQLQRAAALSPDLAETYFHLANAYRRTGERGKRDLALTRFQTLKDQDLEKRAAGWKSLFRVSRNGS